MARRHGDDLDGRSIPLFRHRVDVDEESLCDLTAAVWDRVSDESRLGLLRLVCERLQLSVPPVGARVTISRECTFRVDDALRPRRLDFLVEVDGWGVVGIEAKRSQFEWMSSGPHKFSMYAQEVARRSGGVAIMLALTPEPVSGGDLDTGGAAAEVGGLTWLAFASMMAEAPATRTDEYLFLELRGALGDAGLLSRLKEVRMETLRDFAGARKALAETIESVDAFLGVLGREAGHGLTEEERWGMGEAMAEGEGITDPYFTRPYVALYPRCAPGLREHAGVAVVVDLEAGVFHLLAGYGLPPGSKAAPGEPQRWLARGIASGLRFFAWQEAGVSTFPCDEDGAAALAAFPSPVGTEDWEWRGVARTIPFGEATAAFGAVMFESVRAELAGLAATGMVAMAVDAPAMPAPPLAKVLGLASAWGIDGLPQNEEGAEREDAWGWRPERVRDLFFRRCTDRKGAWRGPRVVRGRWTEPFEGGAIYAGVDGPMCCGAKLPPPKPTSRCPVCGSSYWKKYVVACQTEG